MASFFANKYVQMLLGWIYRKVILPYLQDKGLDLLVDVRTKAVVKEFEEKYGKLVKEFDELKAKNQLTEQEIVRIRNEKIKLEEQLINGVKR